MQLYLVFYAFFLVASHFVAALPEALAQASPEASTQVEGESKIEQRAVSLGVYYCTGSGWTSKCWHRKGLSAGVIYYVGPSYNDQVKSFGPDQGTRCTLCVHDDCSLANDGAFSAVVYYPGISNLGSHSLQTYNYAWSYSGINYGSSWWGSRVSAFLCYPS
ncbi:hypothetical protein TWF694_011856 [Orbilia ellipsospora]|uniref:Uncharacterized protein n=1 Tax=Orbilia ellipsospora TaxID=2528407 RepID=A0AAV9X9E4_9PEZI